MVSRTWLKGEPAAIVVTDTVEDVVFDALVPQMALDLISEVRRDCHIAFIRFTLYSYAKLPQSYSPALVAPSTSP